MGKKILFVCRSGALRSPTFSKWFNENTKHEAQFAAIEKSNVDEKHITKEKAEWADLIVVMEMWHAKKIKKEFPELKTPVIVLDIRDEYPRDDFYLIGRAIRLSKTLEGENES